MQVYRSNQIIVRYDPQRLDARSRVRKGLASSVCVSTKPWVNVDGAPVDDIQGQVSACPSGALSYELVKG